MSFRDVPPFVTSRTKPNTIQTPKAIPGKYPRSRAMASFAVATSTLLVLFQRPRPHAGAMCGHCSQPDRTCFGWRGSESY